MSCRRNFENNAATITNAKSRAVIIAACILLHGCITAVRRKDHHTCIRARKHRGSKYIECQYGCEKFHKGI